MNQLHIYPLSFELPFNNLIFFFFSILQGTSLFKFVLFPTFWGTLNYNFQELASTMGCCCSVTKVVSDSLDCSTLGFPVLQYLPELAQTHVHWFGDGIQPSHSLLPLCPPDISLFQHQGLFQWVSSLHQVARVLELQLQHQWILRADFLWDWLGWSPCCPGALKSLFLLSLVYGPTLASIQYYGWVGKLILTLLTFICAVLHQHAKIRPHQVGNFINKPLN